MIGTEVLAEEMKELLKQIEEQRKKAEELAKAMKELGNCKVFQAGEPSAEDGYIKTREILEKLND